MIAGVRRIVREPVTLRTTRKTYVVLGTVLSLPLVLWCIAIALGAKVGLGETLVALGMPAIAMAWLAYYRLRLDDWGIEYRDLLGRNARASWSEVSCMKSQWIGRANGYAWWLHFHDGRKISINLGPFPRNALDLLRERIPCA